METEERRDGGSSSPPPSSSSTSSSSSKGGRHHLVLIPGFGAFDALGQIYYYAGVSELFQRWKRDNGTQTFPGGVELHYFDNFPTASVATRAKKLRLFLAGLISRGSIQDHDTISLIGHSTGGLDIRQLLQDLNRKERKRVQIDVNNEVSCEKMLRMIQKVVFISVPQLGTNIADWVYNQYLVCHGSIALMDILYQFSFLPLVKPAFYRVTEFLQTKIDSDLLQAARDAFAEANPSNAKDPVNKALFRENDAELKLFLSQMFRDFSAIYDLRVEGAPTQNLEEEKSLWKRHGIQTRSYATIGKRIYNFPNDSRPAEMGLLEFLNLLRTGGADATHRTDVLYQGAYRACSGGPFHDTYEEQQLGNIGVLTSSFGSGRQYEIRPWDSDGIVNTASMLWPNGRETILVEGDHGDIIGHYQLIRDPKGGRDNNPRRHYQSYDLLRSDSGFDPKRFEDVWSSIFAFCLQ